MCPCAPAKSETVPYRGRERLHDSLSETNSAGSTATAAVITASTTICSKAASFLEKRTSPKHTDFASYLRPAIKRGIFSFSSFDGRVPFYIGASTSHRTDTNEDPLQKKKNNKMKNGRPTPAANISSVRLD